MQQAAAGQQGRQRPPHGPGHFLPAFGPDGLPVQRIAAEQLIRTLAREHDLDPLPRRLAQEIQRHLRRVGHRLVQIPLNGAVRRKKIIRGHGGFGQRHAQRLRRGTGGRQLGIRFLGVTHREALHGGLAAGHLAGDERRVHPARQKAADLNIGNAVGIGALGDSVPDLTRPSPQTAPPLCPEPRRGIAGQRDPARLPGQRMGGRQLINAGEQRLGIGQVLHAQPVGQTGLVQALFKGRVSQKRLDLAGKEQRLALFIIAERLDAEQVPRTEQRAAGAVPHRKREHPAQAAGQAAAPFLIPVEQDLGVGIRGKRVAALLQSGTQGLVVVNFAVEHDHQRAILIEHRLAAARQINDRQPPMPERRGAVGVAALAVGAAVTDEVRHALHDLFGRRRVLPGRGKADDAAHVFVTPF